MVIDDKNVAVHVKGKTIKIVLVLSAISLAAFTVWFTPLPYAEFKSCDRQCHELEWPMICRFQLKLESHKTLPSYCQNCSQNRDVCFENGCANLNHRTELITTANGLVVGPHFHVCANDVVVVDVVNLLPARSATVHWKGQNQKGSQVMDGAPMITQCPILSGTTFQYKFRAVDPGTHTWHLYTDKDNDDGSFDLFGMFVVRESFRQDVLKFLYDIDSSEHVMAISTKTLEDNTVKLLINGRIADSTATNREQLNYRLQSGLRHRFRIAASHNVANINCPLQLSIEKHTLNVISLDGNPITPFYSDSVKILAGDRIDVVLNANKEPDDTYKLCVTVVENCSTNALNLPEEAWVTVKYNSTKNKRTVIMERSEISPKLSAKHADSYDSKATDCNDCLADSSQITNWNAMPLNLRKQIADKTVYLNYHYSFVPSAILPTNSLLDDHFVRGDTLVSCVNNVTFLYPPSPLISQPQQIPDEMICDTDEPKKSCSRTNSAAGECCSCLRIIHVDKSTVVDVVLLHRGSASAKGRYLTFHLHGHKFYLIGRFNFSNDLIIADEVNNFDRLFENINLKNAALRDTVSVSNQEAVVVRFEANNPGYWMLSEMTGNPGMNVIFHVGELHDLPAAPPNFPQCGNFVGPKYFLT